MKTVAPKAGNTHDEVIRNLLKPDQGRSDRLVINGFYGGGEPRAGQLVKVVE